MADGNHLWKLPIGKAFLEVMCVLVVFSMVRIIVVSVKKAWIVSTAVVILLSFANFYVVKCRGNALIPLDILSYRTALNVVGGYTLTIYPIQFYGLILLLLGCSRHIQSVDFLILTKMEIRYLQG